jgi:hypothetical protein
MRTETMSHYYKGKGQKLRGVRPSGQNGAEILVLEIRDRFVPGIQRCSRHLPVT